MARFCPILHLNGYKINNPTLLARISHEELENLMRGYGWTPYFVEGSDPETMHQAMAATVEHCIQEIRAVPAGMPEHRRGQAAALADDRAALSERMGRAARSRRSLARGILARPPGSADRRQEEPRTTPASSRSGCAARSRRNCSTRMASSFRNSRNSRPPGPAA